MVPITGTPVHRAHAKMQRMYATCIATALKGELGKSARAAKTIMRWTGVSERTAKYWLAGAKAPSGWQLILLARNSDAIMQEFLRLSNRDLYKVSIELEAAEAALVRAAAIVHALKGATR
ncbi:hypothetical protein ACQZ44_09530 [Agrobacterium vitis]